ncbi:MAG: hypothetical protein NFV71_01505, partial [Candidatus Accumulibacter sp.]|nr:hypothetical protein [Accumulibacter sp.]MDS4048175.1 hypothetical protein [Accumulibacter sp.]
ILVGATRAWKNAGWLPVTKSTSVPNSRIANQWLTRGLIKRLIRGIGGRKEQRCRSGERETLDRWLVGELVPGNFLRSLSPVRASARWPVLPLTGLSKLRADE